MKGILFKPDMIPAIVDRRKTHTRRLEDGLKEINQEPDRWGVHRGKNGFIFVDVQQPDDLSLRVFIKPRYHTGETVYIKEALYRHPYLNEAGYLSDEAAVMVNQAIGVSLKWQWKRDSLSPLHCPREAARHFIKILAVRAERLQEITEEDVLAEGITVMRGTWQSKKWNWKTRRLELTGEQYPYTGRYHFEVIWDSLNPKYPWESNPWVFPYEFELVKER